MSSSKFPKYSLQDKPELMGFKIEEITFENHYNVRAPHSHDYYEIFLFKSGGGDHLIDFKNIDISAHSIHLVLPGQLHQVNRVSSSTGCVIMFSKDYVLNDPKLGKTLLEFPFARPEKEPFIGELSLELFDEFNSLISTIKNFKDTSSLNSKEIIQSFLNIILLKFQEVFSSRKSNFSELTNLFFYIVEERYKSHLSISEIAGLLNVTEKILKSSIAKDCDGTITSILHERLLLEAKRLLANTSKTAKEIAYDLNFKDPSYFNRFFKNAEGITPSKFRAIQ